MELLLIRKLNRPGNGGVDFVSSTLIPRSSMTLPPGQTRLATRRGFWLPRGGIQFLGWGEFPFFFLPPPWDHKDDPDMFTGIRSRYGRNMT